MSIYSYKLSHSYSNLHYTSMPYLPLFHIPYMVLFRLHWQEPLLRHKLMYRSHNCRYNIYYLMLPFLYYCSSIYMSSSLPYMNICNMHCFLHSWKYLVPASNISHFRIRMCWLMCFLRSGSSWPYISYTNLFPTGYNWLLRYSPCFPSYRNYPLPLHIPSYRLTVHNCCRSLYILHYR